MGAGDDYVTKTSRKSLKLLGSVGEPINPEAWEWYFNVVGDGRCPIVDTWWQTETGGILITPLPGATKLKPGSATLPFFGVEPALVDGEGNLLEGEAAGNLVILDAWPGTGPHRLRRPPALRRHLFLHLQRQVLHRRRLPPRRGRLLLDHGPRRRRDQRRRPPHGHGGDRIGAGRAPQSLRGGRGRLSARHQGPGHLLLCHADVGRGSVATRSETELRDWVRKEIGPIAVAGPTSSSRRVCRRRAQARSCAASCARSRRTISPISATPRRSPILRGRRPGREPAEPEIGLTGLRVRRCLHRQGAGDLVQKGVPRVLGLAGEALLERRC